VIATSPSAPAGGPAKPVSVHVLAKPSGAVCNLGCTYCYFLDKEALYPGDRFRMPAEVVEAYIDQTIAANVVPEVSISWQGGEPTLMGVDFYRAAVEHESKHRKPGRSIHNTIQTNGTLLTDEWGEFLADHGFLVGISIDGPEPLHDAYRVDKHGGGTFDKVMAGLRLLQKHEVDFNVLTTVNRINGDHPLDVYRFLRDQAGATWIQFIPIIERVDGAGLPADLRGELVSDRSVRAEQFGEFLVTVFDEWIRHDVGTVHVQTFEAAAHNWAGMPSSSLCIFDETCGRAVALEHNGDLYSCDHYVDPEYLLGNIVETPIEILVSGQQQRSFGEAKRDALPQYCHDCDVLFACRGECPKNRFITTPAGEPGLNYLCAGYMRFFRHINQPVRTMIDLVRSGRPASDIMAMVAAQDEAVRRAGRNDSCPCGSGRKTKHCHGAPPTHQPTTMPQGTGLPRPRVFET